MDRIRQAVGDNGQPTWADAGTRWLAVGGLPQLIAALAENFQFSTPQAVRSDKVSLWLVDGRWKTDKLAELLPDQKEKILAGGPADLTRLSAQLPTEVRVVLGQSDLLPPHRVLAEGRWPGCVGEQPRSAAADDWCWKSSKSNAARAWTEPCFPISRASRRSQTTPTSTCKPSNSRRGAKPSQSRAEHTPPKPNKSGLSTGAHGAPVVTRRIRRDVLDHAKESSRRRGNPRLTRSRRRRRASAHTPAPAATG